MLHAGTAILARAGMELPGSRDLLALIIIILLVISSSREVFQIFSGGRDASCMSFAARGRRDPRAAGRRPAGSMIKYDNFWSYLTVGLIEDPRRLQLRARRNPIPQASAYTGVCRRADRIPLAICIGACCEMMSFVSRARGGRVREGKPTGQGSKELTFNV